MPRRTSAAPQQFPPPKTGIGPRPCANAGIGIAGHSVVMTNVNSFLPAYVTGSHQRLEVQLALSRKSIPRFRCMVSMASHAGVAGTDDDGEPGAVRTRDFAPPGRQIV